MATIHKRDHVLSELLYAHEKEALIQRLGHNKQILASGVAQLLIPNRARLGWTLSKAGVVCLVKDFDKKIHVIQFFTWIDETVNIMLEQRVYKNFEIRQSSEQLLQFAGEDNVYGLNFGSAPGSHHSEAGAFRMAFIHLEERRRKRHQRSEPNAMPNPVVKAPMTVQKAKKSKKRNKKLTGSDIGLPKQFLHLTHVDIAPEKCFMNKAAKNVPKLDPQIRGLLESIGESADQLDREEQAFVCDFIEKQGGLGSMPKAATGTFRATLHPSASFTSPALRPLESATPKQEAQACFYSTVPRARVACAPPPPPPPPGPPPLPPLQQPSFDDACSGHRNEPVDRSGNARGDLLAEIQQGKQLRSVGSKDTVPKFATVGATAGGGIAAALAKALAERREQMGQGASDSEDCAESSNSDDADWDE